MTLDAHGRVGRRSVYEAGRQVSQEGKKKGVQSYWYGSKMWR